MRFLWKSYLRFTGWDTDLSFPYHHLKKYIVIVGPHTSNWDFIIGLAYRNLVGMNAVKFLGKKELFGPPFGYLFKNLGGIPVDRHRQNHMVDDVVQLFHSHEYFALALSPEGTRSKVSKLRTGFYYIARKAGVPIIMVGLDYKNKKVVFSEPLFVTEESRDFRIIHDFYRPIQGKHPELGLMDK